MALMKAAPVVMWRAMAVPCAGPEVQMLRLSPYGVALASRMAWASSLAMEMVATGPKVSSSKAVMPGFVSARMVGSKK